MNQQRWHPQRSCRPSLREYLANDWVTSTGPFLLLHAFPAAGAAADRRWRSSAGAAELSFTIFRLCNDGTFARGHSDTPSVIACCMEEACCAGKEQARTAVQGLVADTWKEMCLRIRA